MTAFVEPPIAISSVIALSNASRGQDLRSGAGPLRGQLDRARPGRLGGHAATGVDRRDRRASRAGDMPSASTSAVIVEAVPISLQCPYDGVAAASSSSNSSCVIRPARSSSA